MNSNQGNTIYGKMDERTKTVAQAGDALALRILLFALLLDVIYRSLYLKDPSWDIMGMVIGGGLISFIYQIAHRLFPSKTHLIKFIIFAVVLGAALGFIIGVVVIPLLR